MLKEGSSHGVWGGVGVYGEGPRPVRVSKDRAVSKLFPDGVKGAPLFIGGGGSEASFLQEGSQRFRDLREAGYPVSKIVGTPQEAPELLEGPWVRHLRDRAGLLGVNTHPVFVNDPATPGDGGGAKGHLVRFQPDVILPEPLKRSTQVL